MPASRNNANVRKTSLGIDESLPTWTSSLYDRNHKFRAQLSPGTMPVCSLALVLAADVIALAGTFALAGPKCPVGEAT